MPNLWSRVQEMFEADSHATLDRLENPAHMSQHLIREVDSDLHALRQRLVAAVSRMRQLDQALRVIGEQHQEQHHRAAAALSAGDESLARHHLGLHCKLEGELKQVQELAANHRQWVEGLRAERASLLRERESLGSQARLINLRAGLQGSSAPPEPELYSKVMRRRERMDRYAQQMLGSLDDLLAAQTLRREELGDTEPAEDAAVSAALAQLKLDLNHKENAA